MLILPQDNHHTVLRLPGQININNSIDTYIEVYRL